VKQSEANRLHEIAALLWQEVAEAAGHPRNFAVSYNDEIQQFIVIAKTERQVLALQRGLTEVFKGGIQRGISTPFEQDVSQKDIKKAGYHD
jgi:hypothetical protein